MENTIRINDLILSINDTEAPKKELKNNLDLYNTLFQRFEVLCDENEELKDSVENIFFIQSLVDSEFPFCIILSEQGACVATLRSKYKDIEPVDESFCDSCQALEKLKHYFKSKEPYRIFRVDSDRNVYIPTEIETFLISAI